jgi:hypothetical protein
VLRLALEPRDYPYCRFCKRSRIPGSSLGEPMNWTPPATSAASISESVCVRPGGSPSTASRRIMVRALTPDLSANLSIDQFNAALPARICAPTIIDKAPQVSYKLTISSNHMTMSSVSPLLKAEIPCESVSVNLSEERRP